MNQLILPHIGRPSAKVATSALSTNVTTWKYPIHRWYNFIAGYSPEFVRHCIAESALERGRTVLDPFSGCGTTLVQAQIEGMKAIGYEPHPFFFKIARAKSSAFPGYEELRVIHQLIIAGLEIDPAPDSISADAWTFLNKLFAPSVLRSLLGARISLERANLGDNPFAFLILSRLIDECSTAQTDGIYKAPSSLKRAAIPRLAIDHLIATIAADLGESSDQILNDASLYNHSSEEMGEVDGGSVDLIVTSPPYLNNFDYAEMARMHLYFWNMAGSWSEITDLVRSRLIVNTTTALKGQRLKQADYAGELPEGVRQEIEAIAAQLSLIKKDRKGKKDYDLLLLPYMAQIKRVYSECFRVLRPGAKAHTMIADAAFYGVHIPSPQWLSEILKHIGFSKVDCVQVRKRGHRWILSKRDGSPTGLGEYHITAVR
jgi:DNA modification methylase